MLLAQSIESFQQEVVNRINDPDWTWEEACEMGLSARNLRDLTNWIIGTVAYGIKAKWGEDRMGEFAKLLGFEKNTVEQYRWVVKKFGPNYQPAQDLPWSFYRIAAGHENPQEAIDHIIDNNLSYKEAERYVKGLPLARECEHDFKNVIFKRCKKCNILKQDENGL